MEQRSPKTSDEQSVMPEKKIRGTSTTATTMVVPIVVAVVQAIFKKIWIPLPKKDSRKEGDLVL